MLEPQLFRMLFLPSSGRERGVSDEKVAGSRPNRGVCIDVSFPVPAPVCGQTSGGLPIMLFRALSGHVPNSLQDYRSPLAARGNRSGSHRTAQDSGLQSQTKGIRKR